MKQEADADDGEKEGDAEEEEEESQPQVVTASPAGPNKMYVKKEFSDVAFFRLGYFNYQKLNVQNMLQKYDEDTWYTIDLILDYDEQRVSIYVDEKPIKSAEFFTQRKTKLDSGNAVSIYGLSPEGSSSFRNIQMCEKICPDFSDIEFENLSGALAGYGTAILSISALLLSITI